MTTGLFNTHTKVNAPLSEHLWRRASFIDKKIQAVRDLDELAALEVELDNLLAEAHITPPTLGGTAPASQGEGDTRWTQDRQMGLPTTRHFVVVQVNGDIDVLKFWPDATGPNLLPVDAEAVSTEGIDRLRDVDDAQVTAYWDASMTWYIGARSADGPGELALYTHMDLTEAEESAVESGELDVLATFQERRARVEPIVVAIAEQTKQFFSTTLPKAVREVVEGKRAKLRARRAVSDSLNFPDHWVTPDPELEPETSTKIVETEPESTPADDTERASTRGEVDYDPHSRLGAATFTHVQETIRLWADAVERYPNTFAKLHEDRLSDLLAATLNATVSGAGREVFSHNGKSDIFIEAEDLARGRGPARVFILESKWATGHDVIKEALDPQLFGYLNVHDTAAILLILTPQKDFASMRATYVGVLEGVAGHVETREGHVSGWPELEFRRDGRAVKICAAFVHLPR